MSLSNICFFFICSSSFSFYLFRPFIIIIFSQTGLEKLLGSLQIQLIFFNYHVLPSVFNYFFFSRLLITYCNTIFTLGFWLFHGFYSFNTCLFFVCSYFSISEFHLKCVNFCVCVNVGAAPATVVWVFICFYFFRN